MSTPPTPLRLMAFGACLLGTLAAAILAGRLSGVDGDAVTEAAPHDDHGTSAGATHSDGIAAPPAGLQVADDGYAIEILDYPTEPGPEQDLRFRIYEPDGRPVTEYIEAHEADLHLIVVRRDLTDYQHVHPELAADGTWSVPIVFATAGSYRVFADFVPAGCTDGLTLGVDLAVQGEFTPAQIGPPAQAAEVDGYTVTLNGDLVAGTASHVTLSVSHEGEPVTDLEPYLGANGHLVALRVGDLAYLHVHPEDETTDGPARGPEVGFVVQAPSDGTYRLFFEFQHGGTVRTAEITVEAGHGH